MNFDKPFAKYFNKGKIRLKKLLMFEPELICQIDMGKNSKCIVFGVDSQGTEREEQNDKSLQNISIDPDNVIDIKSKSSKYNPPNNSLKSNKEKNSIINMRLKKKNNTASANISNSNKSSQSIKRTYNNDNDILNTRPQKGSMTQIKENRSIEYENYNDNGSTDYKKQYQFSHTNQSENKYENNTRQLHDCDISNYNNGEEDDNDNDAIEQRDIKDIIINERNSKHQNIKEKAPLKKTNSNQLNNSQVNNPNKYTYIKPENNSIKLKQKNNNTNKNLKDNPEMDVIKNEDLDQLSLLKKEEKEIVFRFQLTESEYRYYLQEKAKMVLK